MREREQNIYDEFIVGMQLNMKQGMYMLEDKGMRMNQ